MTTTLRSQNGWAVVESADDPRLDVWTIPASNGTFRIRLRRGVAGLLLAHFILWFAETIQAVIGKQLDDWGWSPLRNVRGGSTDISNHCSGTAVDLNSMQHPLAARGTFARWQYVKIRARLLLYAGCIRSGIDYQNRADEMHHEVNRSLRACRPVARRIGRTARGKRLLAANPDQRRFIYPKESAA
jgi:hypothetical protein